MCTALAAPRQCTEVDCCAHQSGSGPGGGVGPGGAGWGGALWVSLLCPEKKPGWPRDHECHQTSSFFPLNLLSSYFEGIKS